MADIREGILSRLVGVVAAVPGINSVHRNNTDITDDQMPAALVLDGDEDVATDKSQPMLVEMTPEIQIVEQSGAIGSDLTTFRAQLIKLVLSDATINALTGSNGKIRYLGCETSFGWQEKQYGALQMRFSFKYPLKLTDL
jgi:hypothetical protein